MAAPTSSRGSGSRTMRARNVTAIVQTILAHRAVSRAEIAQETGLSPTSLTTITAELLNRELLVELPSATPVDRGRPRVPLTLHPSAYLVAGVHIGLRWTRAGLVTLGGDVVAEDIVTHKRTAPRYILGQAGRLLDKLCRQSNSRSRIIGTGVATGGWVDDATVMEHAPLGWERIDVGHRLGAPGGSATFVDSSVRALALAETLFGAARTVDSAMYVFVGNVVGAALVTDRHILSGHGSAAGTIDHLPVGPNTGPRCRCGRRGCLYMVATDLAVAQRGRERAIIGPDQNFEDVVAADLAGNVSAHRLLRQRADHVATAIDLLMDIVDPELVVVAGGILDGRGHFSRLLDSRHRRTTRNQNYSDLIVPTALGDQSLVRGAASLALEAFYRDPLAMIDATAG